MRKTEYYFQLAKLAYWRHCVAAAGREFPSEMVAGNDGTAHDLRRVLFHDSKRGAEIFPDRRGVAFGAFVSGEVWSRVTSRRDYPHFSYRAAPYELRKSIASLF